MDICQKQGRFYKRSKETFGNDKKVLKNLIKIYLENNEMITFEQSDRHKILLDNASFYWQYLKTEEDINNGFLEEGEGVSQTGNHFP